MKVLGVLALLPWLATAESSATPPVPSSSAQPGTPCGFVSFAPADGPQLANGTTYERIRVTVSFRDGHSETAEFPYPWVYPNAEQTDPWSKTNIGRPDIAVTLQRPPPGADVKTFPLLIQYVLQHTDAAGYTDLPGCGLRRSASEITLPDRPSAALQRASMAWEVIGKATETMRLADDTPRNAPVTIVDASMYGAPYFTFPLVVACVTFRNASPRTVTAVRFTFTYFASAGRQHAVRPLTRLGTFRPGAVMAGLRRAEPGSRPDAEAMKNCDMFERSDKLGPSRVVVTAVEFADHSIWPPGSSAASWPNSL